MWNLREWNLYCIETSEAFLASKNWCRALWLPSACMLLLDHQHSRSDRVVSRINIHIANFAHLNPPNALITAWARLASVQLGTKWARLIQTWQLDGGSGTEFWCLWFEGEPYESLKSSWLGVASTCKQPRSLSTCLIETASWTTWVRATALSFSSKYRNCLLFFPTR